LFEDNKDVVKNNTFHVSPNSYDDTSSLNIIGWNCEGFLSKQSSISTLAEFGRPDALLLQETFMTESTGIEHRGTVKGYVMTAQSKDRYMKEKKEKSRYMNRHGVGTLLKEELTKRSKFIESGSDRVLAQKIYMGKRTLLLINSYCPTRDQSMQGLRDFEECLSRISGLIAEHCGKDCSFALYADWNLCPVKHAKDKKTNQGDEQLSEDYKWCVLCPKCSNILRQKTGRSMLLARRSHNEQRREGKHNDKS